jgi:TfoX/Sxy family transcriptional regulator of competence genes
MASTGKSGGRAWEKAPPALVARFKYALPHDARVEPRQMFGYPCAFVGGNMFAGLHEHRVVVRLGTEAAARHVAAGTAAAFEPMGRPMREYVVVPSDAAEETKALAAWVDRGFRFTAGLPPKAPRRKGAGAGPPAARRPTARKR